MEFGKIDIAQLAQITFEMPEIKQENLFFKNENTKELSRKPKIFVGCPVWANKNWVSVWYPAHAKEKDFLGYYAQLFNTIELNSTHYQIPSTQTIKNWCEKVPKNFQFCPKFPQEISHKLLFKNDAKLKDFTHYFWETMQFFGQNLGTSFLQLPPYFSPKDSHLLLDFCENMRKGEMRDFEFSVEFRHEDWFLGDNLAKITQKLVDYDIGTVITDTAGRRDAVHFALSTPTLMLRFVGNDLHDSDFERVDKWFVVLSNLLGKNPEIETEITQKNISKLYFFAHEPNNDFAPDLALYFVQKMILLQKNLSKNINENLILPKKIDKGQMELF